MHIKSLYTSERFLKMMFGISLFIVLVMGGLAYKYIKQLSDAIEGVQYTYQVHIELEKLLSAIKDAESGKRAFIISRDSTFLQPLIMSGSEVENILDRLKTLTADNPEQQTKIAGIENKIERTLVIFDKTLALALNNETNSVEFLTAFREGRQIMNSVRFEIMEMTTYENEVLGTRKELSSKRLSNAPVLIYYVLIFSLLILLMIYLQISKNIKILKEKNELLETFKESRTQSEIISQLGNWIWFIDTNTFEFSDNLYRLIGEEPQSFEPNFDNFSNFVYPEDINRFVKQIDKMKESEDLPFIRYRIVQLDGVIKHFKSYGKVLIDSEGRRKLLGITIDITDEIENFRLTEERNLELERSNKELASFNYVASHDLQEPLRKIQTFLSRITENEQDKLSDNAKVYIERIRSSAERMRALIDDLLKFSRTNRSDEAMEDSNINILLESAKHDLIEIISEKKARIKSDSIPEMKVIPFQIKQLFFNLLSNSLKYSRENTVPIITITYSKTIASDVPTIKHSKYKDYHTITVKDNGIGFEQEYAQNIFVLFNRLHSKNEYSGTGIGLSICKKIVENHNGIITAESDPAIGSIFTVYIPTTT